MNAVSKETEISAHDIMSQRKTTEVVDARTIAVVLMMEYGFYPEQIAKFMGKTSACVRYLASSFESRKRCNRMVEIHLQNIRKAIAN